MWWVSVSPLAFAQRCPTGDGDTASRGARGFPGGAVVENLPANAEDMGLIPGPGRSHVPQSN